MRNSSFATHTLGRIAYWGSWLDDRSAAGEPIVVWGGGAKGLTFLNMLAEHARPVSAVVDINPGLQHHYIGGLGLPIVAPQDLVSTPPRTVLLMNPIYQQEVRAGNVLMPTLAGSPAVGYSGTVGIGLSGLPASSSTSRGSSAPSR